MRSDRKQTILFIILLLMLSLGIGYAFLTTTLSIDGVSDIDSANWDVHFENVQVQSGSVTGTQVTTPATISVDGQTVSYHIKLNEPGDNYTFKVDVVNDGSLSAKISNILFKINGVEATMAPAYLAQYVLYEDYSPVTISQIINPGETKTLLSGIHYRDDVEPEELPTADQSLTISFGLVYDQTSSSGYVYSYNSDAFLGDSIANSSGVFYNDLSFAIADSVYNSSMRYKVNNSIVEEMGIGFIYNSNEYYLIAASDNSTYEYNKSVLQSAFGSSKCTEDAQEYRCYDSNEDLEAVAYNYGYVLSRTECYGCYASGRNGYNCGYTCTN